MQLIEKRYLFIGVIVFALAGLLVLVLVGIKPGVPRATESLLPEGTSVEMREVRGQSLEPIIPEGSEVQLALDPNYALPIARGDVVVFRSGNTDAVKIVHGIPGDKLALKETGKDTYNILVNDEVVKNSEDKPYMVGDSGYRMLSLYINDYKGVIPANAYLLLGDRPSGSRDSTAFGLVDRSDILGKVIR